MNMKKGTISLGIWMVAVAVLLAGVGVGVGIGMDSKNSDNPGKGKGKGKPVKEENYTFAGNAQLLSVDSENRSITIFVDAGSYTTKDFKRKQKNAVVDEGAEISIGDEPATLEEIAEFERAYIFGRQKGQEIYIKKILVPTP